MHVMPGSELGWTRIVRWAYGSADGGDPSADEIAEAWEEWGAIPRIDLGGEVMRYADARDFVEGCADEHGVTFDPVGWCDPWVADFANDDPGEEAIRYDFTAPLPGGGGWVALASVDVTGAEEPRCRTTQLGGEP